MLGLLENYLGLIIVGTGTFLFIVFHFLSRSGFKPALRPIRGYETLSKQVGEAVESGGRMHVSLGPNRIIDEGTGVTLAGLAVLDIVSEASAISDQNPIVTTSDAATLPVAADTIRHSYRRQGVIDKFETKSARLIALDPIGLAGGTTSVIADDDVRANIMIGSFGPEVTLMAEAGIRQEIPQTVGSDRLEAQAAAFTMVDHLLIGEEIFVGRAYLSDDPSATASVATQDVLRWLIIGVIVFGIILQSLGLLG
jgi:hypothetical protein